MLNNELWQAPPAGGGDFYEHQIVSSLRNSASQDGTLKFTAGTPTSGTTFTYSYWVKRYDNGTASNDLNIFVCGSGGASYVFWGFSSNKFQGEFTGGTYGDTRLVTNAVYRDTSAWYHHVLRFDSTQATATNRVRLYVNGTEVSYSSQTVTGAIDEDEVFPNLNANGIVQAWGGLSGKGHGTEGANLQMAEIVFNDGQSYGPDSYGETKNGVWIPKDPSGLTFGNNGYWLKMASGAIGTDSSGNGNNFTVANFAAHDVLLDSPTFGSSSSGNFPTINPLFKHEDIVLSEANLKHKTSTNQRGVMCNIQIPKTGKWYWEHLSVSFNYPTDDELHGVGVNVQSVDIDASRGGRATGITYASYNGGKSIEADGTASYGAAWAEGDIVGVEFDSDNGTINFSKNGSFQGDISLTAAQQAKEWFPYIAMGGGTSEEVGIFNFGQDSSFAGEKTAQGNADENGYGDFYYSPPSGVLALCSGNLPTADAVDPAQTDDNFPQKLFGAKLYTGNGGTNAITGLGFKPDVVWGKSRSNTQDHFLADSTNGTGKDLIPNSSVAQQTENGVTAFGTDGWTMGSIYNANTYTYVGWTWRANGGTTAANSVGGTSSVTQVDPSGGFSIVTYTGFSGSSGSSTVGHGMGVAPAMIIHKSRTRSSGWWTQFPNLLTDAGYFLDLSGNGAQTNLNSYGTMNVPTTSVFTINGVDGVGGESANYVAYCFANIEGYCKVGSYIANSDADNAFVYTGFSPAFLMVKGVVSGAAWQIIDNKRDGYNPTPESLEPNSSGASYTGAAPFADLLSNGFKVRTNNAVMGSSSYDPYVYLAFAENPFKYATAR